MNIKRLINEILDHQLANRGQEGIEFYRCYTYNRNELPVWVGEAKQLLQEIEEAESNWLLKVKFLYTVWSNLR